MEKCFGTGCYELTYLLGNRNWFNLPSARKQLKEESYKCWHRIVPKHYENSFLKNSDNANQRRKKSPSPVPFFISCLCLVKRIHIMTFLQSLLFGVFLNNFGSRYPGELCHTYSKIVPWVISVALRIQLIQSPTEHNIYARIHHCLEWYSWPSSTSLCWFCFLLNDPSPVCFSAHLSISIQKKWRLEVMLSPKS